MKGYIYKLPAQSQKKNFLFNMIGSLTNAFVSLALMVVVSYIADSAVAGIFSVAFSTSQMMYTICVFEMRNIQVTDAKQEFSFEHISMLRLITIVAMWLFFIIFTWWKGFDKETVLIMIAITAYMSALAISDLFQGNLHRNGYLSIAGRSLACQVALMAVAFTLVLVITKELLIAAISMPIVVLVWILVHDIPYNNNFNRFKPKFELGM